MSSEQRLDRLERMLLLVVKAGARERKVIRKRFKETDEKIDALIDAQIRTGDALTDLTRAHGETEASLKSLINTVESSSASAGTDKHERAQAAGGFAATPALSLLVDLFNGHSGNRNTRLDRLDRL
jgi:hypothetical protein